jgi:hypothetical protein
MWTEKNESNTSNSRGNLNHLKITQKTPEKYTGHEIKELQKTAILGTAHTLRKVLMSRYKTFNMRKNITCGINCKYRTAATLYAVEIWFTSGI